jgi:hypothetical protein
LWDLGWFIGQKIGRADEYLQYRKLFKNDVDYHSPDRTPEERDNWLVGKEWYLKAIDAVDNKGKSLGRKSPRDFYSGPAKSTMNYAEAIEEEGFFEKARLAWVKAAEEWRQFGNQFIEHSTGVRLQLGSEQRVTKDLAELRAKLEAMLPGTRAKLAEEKRAALSPEDRALLDLPATKVPADQNEHRYQLDQKVQVTDRQVAERIAREQPANQNQAMQLASEIERQDQLLSFTQAYKRDANYDYWMTRAEFEQTPAALGARTKMYEAREAFRNADLPKAKKLYEEGFAQWRAVIDKFPSILSDEETTGGDLLDFIKRYRTVLDQLDEKIADDFPLWEVIEKFDRENDFPEELKAYRARQGRPLPEDSAPKKPEPAAAEAAPAAAAATPATDAAKKSAEEKSALAPPSTPPTTPAAPTDSKK